MFCVRRFVAAATVLASVAAVFAEGIRRVADPSLSPDGQTLVFAWQGDLWSVPVAGGTARRLTVHPATDALPRWTPDGQRIVFASNRFGNLDVFSMTAQGSDIRRHTFDSGDEYPTASVADGRTVLGYTTGFGGIDLFRTAVNGDLVRLTGHSEELEFYPSVSPDGQAVVYNTGGSPGHWRKPGLTGSNTAQVWIAENRNPLANHRRLTSPGSSNLFPLFAGDDTILFVSNRTGTPNVWRMRRDGSDQRALTRFTSGTIRMLSAGADGTTAVFQKDSALWRLNVATGEAAVIEIEAPMDSRRDPVAEFALTTGATDFAVSPDGRRAVVALRGDLFMIPERGGTTRRLTTSVALDGNPVWLDPRTVLYVAAGPNSKRQLNTVTIEGEVKEWASDALDLTAPRLSPDGKSVAYHRGFNEILVRSVEGGEARVVATGGFGDAFYGARSFNWSPDGKWLVVTNTVQRGQEIALHPVDGGPKIVVAMIGKGASLAAFLPNGKGVYFTAVQGINFSEVRNSTSPLYVVDLVPTDVKFTEDDLDDIDTPAATPAATPVEVKVVERGLRDRMRRLTADSVSGTWATPDSLKIWGNVDGQLSTIDVATGEVRPVAGVTGTVNDMLVVGARQRAYLNQAGRISALNLQNGSVSPVNFNATFTVDMAQEEAALFDEVWWAMDRGFYAPDMHGKDWPGIREEFRKLVPHATSREDFYALMAEMLERLDSSHLGATPSPAGAFRPAVTDETAWMGVEWDPTALGERSVYRVARVYEGTPAALPGTELVVGDRLLAVDGVRLGATQALAPLLNEKAGRKVRLRVDRGGRELEMEFQPARPATRAGALYTNWVRDNRRLVDELSDGRLGYIHVQGMDSAGLDTFLREIQTELNDRDGVIVDVRYNGGGFTGQIILNTMIKTPWLFRTQRDMPGYKFSENQWRGNALELPAAAMINQYSFSNAEVFAEGFRRLELGPIIGEATAGGVIGTTSYALWDGGSIRMPASGAFAIDGENLEGNGRRPDVEVWWDPNAWMRGRDVQIERAVQELLKRLPARQG